MGNAVKLILNRQIKSYWHNIKDMRVVGIGYTQPYIESFLEEAERCISISPADIGVYPWPDNKKNLCLLAEETELPIETNSVDRVLLIHSLEFAELPKSNLQEIFRILKSNGRLIIITPNRRGLWSRAEWSPFGNGTPYSGEQLKFLLRDNLFVYERSCQILHALPLRWKLVIKNFHHLEFLTPYILPTMGGIHVVEASKQVYSGSAIGLTEPKVIIRTRPSIATFPT